MAPAPPRRPGGRLKTAARKITGRKAEKIFPSRRLLSFMRRGKRWKYNLKEGRENFPETRPRFPAFLFSATPADIYFTLSLTAPGDLLPFSRRCGNRLPESVSLPIALSCFVPFPACPGTPAWKGLICGSRRRGASYLGGVQGSLGPGIRSLRRKRLYLYGKPLPKTVCLSACVLDMPVNMDAQDQAELGRRIVKRQNGKPAKRSPRGSVREGISVRP